MEVFNEGIRSKFDSDFWTLMSNREVPGMWVAKVNTGPKKVEKMHTFKKI